MADPKKTASKSTTKKTTSNKSNTGIKPVTGKIVPVSGKIQPVSYRPSTPSKKSTTTSKSSTSSKPKSTTTSKSSTSKVTDKKVVKKDGQTTVTYKTPYKGIVGTYPSKVRKIYDSKGNLIKGNQRVEGSYGSYKDIGIKGSKNAAPLKKTAPKPSTPAKTTTTKTTTTKASTPKYVEPGTKAYWAMTPDQRNANTMLNIKESISGGPKKSTTTKKSTTPSKPTPRIAQAPVGKSKQGKVSYNPDWENKKFVAKGDMMVPERKTTTGKNVRSKQDAAKIKGIVEGLERAPQKKKTETKPKPVAPKMPTIIGSAKASVPSKGKVKIEPNMGKPKSFTPPKVETKKVTPKVTPKAAPEPIKMETIPLATVAKQLQDSRPKAELEIPKSVATAPKTPAPAEEKKGLFARMKERREERRAERKAEKEADKKGSAGNALAMRKGGMVKYKKGGSIKKSKKK